MQNGPEGGDGRWVRQDVAALVATVVGFSVYCVFVNSNRFYNPIGWIDPYTHQGLGLYFTDPYFWDNYYKVSRVPWNAAEFVVRHLVKPAVADRKSTRLNSSHVSESRMPSSA